MSAYGIQEEVAPGCWRVPATEPERGIYLTFEFAEGMVGWRTIILNAVAGTVGEIMRHEARDPTTCHWLDSCWSS
ncbi:MAG: hypothetical protein E4H01_14710 [Lysobacterales bacterium]|nr:MAG: hypothetical protein E4H01_14710 [Xanthomonadales bacterium]